MLDDNYLSNATLRDRERKWDKQRNETSIHAKRSLDVACIFRHDEILSLKRVFFLYDEYVLIY